VMVTDLADYPIITYQPQSLFRTYLDPILKEGGVFENIAIQVSLSMTGILLAKAGAGVALVEPYVLAAMDKSALAARPLNPGIEIRTLLLKNRSAPQSLIMSAFIEHLKSVALEPYN